MGKVPQFDKKTILKISQSKQKPALEQDKKIETDLRSFLEEEAEDSERGRPRLTAFQYKMKEYYRKGSLRFKCIIKQMQEDLRISHENNHTKENLALTSPHFGNQLQSRSLNECPEFLDNSFEKDMGEDHVQAIWDASITFLRSVLTEEFDEEKGLGDQLIFPFILENTDSMLGSQSFESVILKNPLINYSSKAQFILDLKSEENLSKLIIKAMDTFPEQAFHEILFIIHESWEEYLRNKKKTIVDKRLSSLLMPALINLDDVENVKRREDVYLPISSDTLVKMAEEASEDFMMTYYQTLKYINLKETELLKKSECVLKEECQKFIYAIVNAVFLSLEGEFDSPANNILEEEPEQILSEEPSFTSLDPRKRSHKEMHNE